MRPTCRSSDRAVHGGHGRLLRDRLDGLTRGRRRFSGLVRTERQAEEEGKRGRAGHGQPPPPHPAPAGVVLDLTPWIMATVADPAAVPGLSCSTRAAVGGSATESVYRRLQFPQQRVPWSAHRQWKGKDASWADHRATRGRRGGGTPRRVDLEHAGQFDEELRRVGGVDRTGLVLDSRGPAPGPCGPRGCWRRAGGRGARKGGRCSFAVVRAVQRLDGDHRGGAALRDGVRGAGGATRAGRLSTSFSSARTGAGTSTEAAPRRPLASSTSTS